MAKIKVGDVFSIKTSKGLAYLHYVGKGWDHIDRVRVLDGVFPDGCDDLESLANKPERFVVGFVIGYAYRTKYIDLAGYVDQKSYPLPKYTRSPNSVRGELKGWRVHDVEAKKYHLYSDLTEDQLKINPSGAFSGPLLIEWLENDFTLEKWNTDFILSNLKKEADKINVKLDHDKN